MRVAEGGLPFAALALARAFHPQIPPIGGGMVATALGEAPPPAAPLRRASSFRRMSHVLREAASEPIRRVASFSWVRRPSAAREQLEEERARRRALAPGTAGLPARSRWSEQSTESAGCAQDTASVVQSWGVEQSGGFFGQLRRRASGSLSSSLSSLSSISLSRSLIYGQGPRATARPNTNANGGGGGGGGYRGAMAEVNEQLAPRSTSNCNCNSSCEVPGGGGRSGSNSNGSREAGGAYFACAEVPPSLANAAAQSSGGLGNSCSSGGLGNSCGSAPTNSSGERGKGYRHSDFHQTKNGFALAAELLSRQLNAAAEARRLAATKAQAGSEAAAGGGGGPADADFPPGVSPAFKAAASITGVRPAALSVSHPGEWAAGSNATTQGAGGASASSAGGRHSRTPSAGGVLVSPGASPRGPAQLGRALSACGRAVGQGFKRGSSWASLGPVSNSASFAQLAADGPPDAPSIKNNANDKDGEWKDGEWLQVQRMVAASAVDREGMSFSESTLRVLPEAASILLAQHVGFLAARAAVERERFRVARAFPEWPQRSRVLAQQLRTRADALSLGPSDSSSLSSPLSLLLAPADASSEARARHATEHAHEGAATCDSTRSPAPPTVFARSCEAERAAAAMALALHAMAFGFDSDGIAPAHATSDALAAACALARLGWAEAVSLSSAHVPVSTAPVSTASVTLYEPLDAAASLAASLSTSLSVSLAASFPDERNDAAVAALAAAGAAALVRRAGHAAEGGSGGGGDEWSDSDDDERAGAATVQGCAPLLRLHKALARCRACDEAHAAAAALAPLPPADTSQFNRQSNGQPSGAHPSPGALPPSLGDMNGGAAVRAFSRAMALAGDDPYSNGNPSLSGSRQWEDSRGLACAQAVGASRELAEAMAHVRALVRVLSDAMARGKEQVAAYSAALVMDPTALAAGNGGEFACVALAVEALISQLLPLACGGSGVGRWPAACRTVADLSIELGGTLIGRAGMCVQERCLRKLVRARRRARQQAAAASSPMELQRLKVPSS
ncbi:hypothetical protein T492DRAFT_231928 [Pavlovales sp. CCMP2436]|nr:hypothetical protein T492DRAFT_231928 [Pavlovales sp. CCMP2436]